VAIGTGGAARGRVNSEHHHTHEAENQQGGEHHQDLLLLFGDTEGHRFDGRRFLDNGEGFGPRRMDFPPARFRHPNTDSTMNSLRCLAGAALAATLCIVTLRAAGPEVGQPAPDFTLTDTNGQAHSLAALKGRTVVLEWVNHGCPFVMKHYGSGNMQKLQKAAAADGVVWLSICSSAPGKQGNLSPADWNKTTAEKGAAPAAVLPDADGRVGHLYHATNTPQLFIINPAGVLVYAGAIDSVASTRPEDLAQAQNYVTAALADLKAGRPVATAATKPYGCSVKY